jgi:SAM-dependent methyltransferase
MDEVYRYNLARWEALVRANALFTRPWLDLDALSARERLDPWHLLGDLAGRRVLCLAGGGGQQSAAFALLGAAVTVLDISAGQLDKDRQAAAHYGVQVVTCQGDMRDLSAFAAAAFDIVWHPYAISFVPDCRVVFKEVARVLRPGGLYHFMVANPFACGMGPRDWNGEGYVVRRPYVEGAEITYQDEAWVGSGQANPGPREYRHTLSRILNGLADDKFVVLKVSEWPGHQPDPEAPPGEWEHFTAYLPPWLSLWALYRPDLTLSVG